MSDVQPPPAPTTTSPSTPSSPAPPGRKATDKAECDLCEAARITPWHYEDDVCWVADCEICDVPMVVWKQHGAAPGDEAVEHMVGHLSRIAAERFGEEPFTIDRVMRQIPDHFHAHARDEGWWFKRFRR